MRAASIFGRVLTWLLVFVLGFMSCVGVIVGGGYWAYSKLTLDRVGVDTSKVLGDTGEVDLSDMSMQQIIAEFMAMKDEKWTVNFLVNRYGLLLSEEIDAFLTDDLRQMDLMTLFSEDGAKPFLDAIYFGKIFGYEKTRNPAYDPMDPEKEPRVIWVDPDTDERIEGINAVLSDISLGEFLDGGIPTDKFMEELSIGDLMELKAKRELPIFIEANGGELTRAEGIDPIVIWFDKDGKEAASIIGALADKGVNDLVTGFDDIELSDVLGTVEYKGKVYTYEYKKAPIEYISLTEAESLIAEFSGLTIDGLTGDEVTEKVNNVEVSSLLGYTFDEETGKWLDKDNNEVNAIMAEIAGSKVGDINKTIDGITFGKIGELVAVDENGDEIDDVANYEGTVTWYEKGYKKGASTNVVATGIIASLADLSVKDMGDENEITEAVKGVLVGDAMGYYKEGDTWYTDELHTTEPSNILAILADCTVGELNGRVGTITFAEISGLIAVDADGNVLDEVDAEAYDGIWYEEYYGKDDARNKPASGLISGLAHLTVDDFGKEDEVTEAVKAIKVGDAMGYKKVDGIWYSEYEEGNDVENEKNKLQGFIKVIADELVGNMDTKAQEVTIADLAGLIAVDNDGNVIDDVDEESYTGVWYEEYYNKDDARNKPTTGLMAGIAHLAMQDIQSSSEVKKAVGKIAIGDAMGYEKVDGVWYTEYKEGDAVANEQNKLTGLVKAIADSPVEELNDDIQDMKFGTVAGLTFDGLVWRDSENEVATGINAALADLTVGEMSDDQALSQAIQKVTVADAMGYTKESDGFYYKGSEKIKGFMAVIAPVKVMDIQATLDDAQIGLFMGYTWNSVEARWEKEGGIPADNLMQKVSSKKMSELDTLINDITLDDVITERTGLLKLVKGDPKVKALSDTFNTMFTSKVAGEGVTIKELKDEGLVPSSINDYFDTWTFAAFMELASAQITIPTP